MKIGIVINSYILTEKGQTHPFDHPTPLWNFEGDNTLLATLKSIAKAKRRQGDELTLYLFAIAAGGDQTFDPAIEQKVQGLVDQIDGLPRVHIISNRQVADFRVQTEIEFFQSSGYPEIRNLGLMIPSMLGEDLIMQVDDDEWIRENHLVRFADLFEANPDCGMMTAAYEQDGSRRINGEDPLPTWKKTSSMDADIKDLISAKGLTQTLFGLGGNLCVRSAVARDLLYPRGVPRGEDFSLILAARLLYENGDAAGGIHPGDGRFLTWFCPEEAVSILHHPPVKEKEDFLRSFETNIKRFILERQMIMSQQAFSLSDLQEASHYLFAMFGQDDYQMQVLDWIDEIRMGRDDVTRADRVNKMEERLLAFLAEVEGQLRWSNYLDDRRRFSHAQACLAQSDKQDLLSKIRGWRS